MTFGSLGEVFAELDAEAQAQAHQAIVQLVGHVEGTGDTRPVQHRLWHVRG